MKAFYQQHLWFRVFLLFLFILFLLFLLIGCFLLFWPSLGGHATKEDRLDYEKRSRNYKNGIFENEKPFTLLQDASANQYLSLKKVLPESYIPTLNPSFLPLLEVKDLTVTWFGHSSLLLQMSKMNILIDPVFSDRSSPVSFIGPKRFSDLPITIDDLPKIDLVLITHDHYDHLDYQTIKRIDEKVDTYIVPLGVENHLEKWSVSSSKIHNMAWWEEYNYHGLTIAMTPAQHFSGRSLNDRFETLWASYVLRNENYKVFDSGDSGFGPHFQEIYDKYGAFDLAFLDSGQYDNRWSFVHMNPEESVKASQILHALYAMPIHWGAFRLANHPWDDSVERFVKEAEQKDISFLTPQIGETIRFEDFNSFHNFWWKDVS